ncbi:MAG: hypothetical protein HRU20_25510 [Pseudomonadales bacterium]|nr:hypothetical protein [Pseudomonadales bacterium]
MRISILVFIGLLAGCASASQEEDTTANITTKEVELVTIYKELIPQVWSGHKALKITAETCAVKGVDILTSLGFKKIVKNGTYVYGNYINNRAAIKCTSVNQQTLSMLLSQAQR